MMFQSNIYRHQTFRYPQIKKNLRNQHGLMNFLGGVKSYVRGVVGQFMLIKTEHIICLEYLGS